MGFLSEPFSQNPLTWGVIVAIVISFIILIFISAVTINPELLPKSDFRKVLESLTCDELKEFMKHNLEYSTPQRIYIDKCLDG